MNELSAAVMSLLFSVAGPVLALAVFPFVLKVLFPLVGEPLWRAYWRLVAWLFMGPFRLAAVLIRAAARRR